MGTTFAGGGRRDRRGNASSISHPACGPFRRFKATGQAGVSTWRGPPSAIKSEPMPRAQTCAQIAEDMRKTAPGLHNKLHNAKVNACCSTQAYTWSSISTCDKNDDRRTSLVSSPHDPVYRRFFPGARRDLIADRARRCLSRSSGRSTGRLGELGPEDAGMGQAQKVPVRARFNRRAGRSSSRQVDDLSHKHRES